MEKDSRATLVDVETVVADILIGGHRRHSSEPADAATKSTVAAASDEDADAATATAAEITGEWVVMRVTRAAAGAGGLAGDDDRNDDEGAGGSAAAPSVPRQERLHGLVVSEHPPFRIRIVEFAFRMFNLPEPGWVYHEVRPLRMRKKDPPTLLANNNAQAAPRVAGDCASGVPPSTERRAAVEQEVARLLWMTMHPEGQLDDTLREAFRRAAVDASASPDYHPYHTPSASASPNRSAARRLDAPGSDVFLPSSGTFSLTVAERRFRRRLVCFFEWHDPFKLPCVADLIRQYGSQQEHLLFSLLVEEYGPEPSEELLGALGLLDPTLPPGWEPVEGSRGDLYYRHTDGARSWSHPASRRNALKYLR